MDHAVEASAERVRHHLRRPLAGSRNLLMKTAGNTVPVTDPCGKYADSARGLRLSLSFDVGIRETDGRTSVGAGSTLPQPSWPVVWWGLPTGFDSGEPRWRR
jgi:hypothetical protein